MSILRTACLFLALICSTTGWAQESVSSALFQTNFEDIDGREGLVVEVEYPPGVASPKHRHNAHTFVYVLEGTVIMQVEGGKAETLGVGQTFYETPDDVHTISMNASDTEIARILVFFVKQQGAPVSVMVP